VPVTISWDRVAAGFQPSGLGEALEKESMDLSLVDIRTFVTQSFFHPVADPRKEPRSRQYPFFLAHGSCLPHLGQEGEAGILGDTVIHVRRLNESPERGKPPIFLFFGEERREKKCAKFKKWKIELAGFESGYDGSLFGIPLAHLAA
jgi:hypothetical protein